MKFEQTKKSIKMSTPQYQAYGGTTARTDSSPASRLDVFKKPIDPDLLAKVNGIRLANFCLITSACIIHKYTSLRT